MAKLRVEKFVGDQCESFDIPLSIVSAAITVLPEAALQALAEKGFDLNAAIEASKQGKAYSVSADVREKGVDKKIVVSVV